MARAIAAFERTLITPDAPFDRFLRGHSASLTEQQRRGFEVFRDVGCASCHAGPAFNGVPLDSERGRDVGFATFPEDTDLDVVKKYRLAKDEGRFEVTGDDENRHVFKISTLRNVTLTAPYFHNGVVRSLDEAVRVMAETQLSSELSDDEVADVVAFLESLKGVSRDDPAATPIDVGPKRSGARCVHPKATTVVPGRNAVETREAPDDATITALLCRSRDQLR